MRLLSYLAAGFFLSVPILALGTETDHTESLPREIKVKVKGIVCSFCAYGAEKNLAKLPFVDKKKLPGGSLNSSSAYRLKKIVSCIALDCTLF